MLSEATVDYTVLTVDLKESLKSALEPSRVQHRAYLHTNLEFLTKFCGFGGDVPEPSVHDLTAALDHIHSAQHDDHSAQLTVQMYVRAMLQSIAKTLGPRQVNAETVLATLKRHIYPFRLLGHGKSCNTLVGHHRLLKKDLCVFKVVKDETAANIRSLRESILIHEVAIGYALNQYRHKLGNWFMFTYAAFLNDLGKANDKIEETTMSVMVLQQYVNGGGLLKLVEGLSVDQVYDLVHHVFLQMACALHLAQTSVAFVHYDLHYDNVLLRTSKSPQKLVLAFDDGFEVEVDDVTVVPTIIDYGYAVCKVNKLLMNHWPCEDTNIISCGNGTHTEWFLPLFDMYRYVTCVLCLLVSDDVRRDDVSACARACRRLRDKWLPYFVEHGGGKNKYTSWCKSKLRTLEELRQWRRQYLDERLAYPAQKDHGCFLEGSLKEWARSVVQ